MKKGMEFVFDVLWEIWIIFITTVGSVIMFPSSIFQLRPNRYSRQVKKEWKSWVDEKERKSQDLMTLVAHGKHLDGCIENALCLLLVPDKKLNSIYWKGPVAQFDYDPEFFKFLPWRWRNRAASCICALLKHTLGGWEGNYAQAFQFYALCMQHLEGSIAKYYQNLYRKLVKKRDYLNMLEDLACYEIKKE